MCSNNKKRNYMTELQTVFNQLRCTQMEPEYCNVWCRPLGCPKGPCPGLCVDECGRVDPCGKSKMPGPCDPPPTCQRRRSPCHLH